MNSPLAGRIALITGASKGLGKAMAFALAKNGAAVALVSRDETMLNQVADEIRTTGGRAEVFVADLTNETDVARVETEVAAKLGKVQILINNAGMNLRKSITDFTLAEWNQVVATNLTSVFLACRAFVPHMQGTGYGRILNMTSIMAHVSLPQRTAYSATKAALLGVTKGTRARTRQRRHHRERHQPRPLRHRDEHAHPEQPRSQRAVRRQNPSGSMGQGGGDRLPRRVPLQ